MKLKFIILLSIVHNFPIQTDCDYFHPKREKCLTPPNTLKRVEKVIKECQEEVKNNIISESFKLIESHWHANPHLTSPSTENDKRFKEHAVNHDSHDIILDINEPYIEQGYHFGQSGSNNMHPKLNTDHKNEYFYYRNDNEHSINRKSDNEYHHPTTISYQDKRIAGCLMHCVYAKNAAINKLGWPTLDGLVNFYSDGVHEHGYFMETLRSVDLCLKGASIKYHINRHKPPGKGESCDLAFDVFDCISDRITEYCSEHHYHRSHG